MPAALIASVTPKFKSRLLATRRPVVTNVPEPHMRRISPSLSSALSASRSVARDTPNSVARAGSEGRREPAGSTPRSIRWLSSSLTWTLRVGMGLVSILSDNFRGQATEGCLHQPNSRLTRSRASPSIRPRLQAVRQLQRPGRSTGAREGVVDLSQERRKVGSVAYQEASPAYFAKRALKRHAAFWSLWSLGVAAVISGDFYGWNVGLAVGGFGGLLIATIFIAVMYYGLVFSIAEMSPALPHTGGAYSFARSAFGPWGGFVTGLPETSDYVITPAVVVGAMGFLMQAIVVSLFNVTGDPWWNSVYVWFIISYIVFVAINIRGIVATMRFTVAINIVALGILAFFFASVLFSGKLNLSLLTNIAPQPGQTSFLPFGLAGIFPAIPFAIWFYLAIEELPLAAEESHDPKRDRKSVCT